MPPPPCLKLRTGLPAPGKRPQIPAHPSTRAFLFRGLLEHLRWRSKVTRPLLEDMTPHPPPQKVSDPLRILFCGSDHFSCTALTALHALHTANRALVESIDVLVRPSKPTGRGLARMSKGPLFQLASTLELPIHQRDTFTGWTLPMPGRVADPKPPHKVTIHPHPQPHPEDQQRQLTHRPYGQFNLLVAVSFGLFVPPRILDALKYGGLNVHPSLLPDLRGPAPIPWAILARRAYTGVTLQTLHPHTFDRGTILAQTPLPGFRIPPDATTASLLDLLGPAGAELLVRGLADCVHVPDYPVVSSSPQAATLPTTTTVADEQDQDHPVPTGDALGSAQVSDSPAAAAADAVSSPTKAPAQQAALSPTPTTTTVEEQDLRDAPKITKQDFAIDWDNAYWAARHHHHHHDWHHWTADDLARRYRALCIDGGTKVTGLYTYAITMLRPLEMRLIFEDVDAVVCPEPLREAVRTILQGAMGRAEEKKRKKEEEEKEEGMGEGKEQGGGDDKATSRLMLWPSGGGKQKGRRPVREVGSVVFHSQPALAIHGKDLRLPVFMDQEGEDGWRSVVIPVRVPYQVVDGEVVMVTGGECDAIRVKSIKVEGYDRKEAGLALDRFWERNLSAKDLAVMEFAVDVIARQTEA